MDDTIKRAKFYVIGFFTFRDMTSKRIPIEKGTSHQDSIFTPWNRVKLEKKSLSMPENIFSGTKLYPLCISMVFKQNKKIDMFNFSRRLISKTIAATPWGIDLPKILPKCV